MRRTMRESVTLPIPVKADSARYDNCSRNFINVTISSGQRLWRYGGPRLFRIRTCRRDSSSASTATEQPEKALN